MPFRPTSGIFGSGGRSESATGVLRHVLVRGIERRPIFRDDTDRAAFVARLAGLGQATGLTGLAWALLPNHAHLLVRTGRAPAVSRARAAGESWERLLEKE